MKKNMTGTKLATMGATLALIGALSQGVMANTDDDRNLQEQNRSQVTEGTTGTEQTYNEQIRNHQPTDSAMSGVNQDQPIRVRDGETLEVRVEEGGKVDVYKSGDAEVDVHDSDDDDDDSGWFN